MNWGFVVPSPIAFVLPFESLVDTARTVAAELNIPVQAVVGDLRIGVERAREAIASGAEVIVSRGGTASAIAAAVPVPVVEIRVTSSDVLRSFSELSAFQGKVGLAGFPNVIYGCAELGSILGLDLVQIPIPGEAEAPRIIAEARAAGVQYVIGDHVSHVCARELGMPAALIGSGREGVAQALFEAQHLLRVRREERERSQQVRTILDSVNDGILAVDGEGRVIVFNPQAERIFGLKAADVLGHPVDRVIPNTRLHIVLREGRSEVGDIQQVGNNRLAVKRTPVTVGSAIVGAVATFNDVTELQRYEQVVRQKLHKKGLVARTSLDQIAGTSQVMQKLLNEARRFAATDATVLILGESGTGKELLAQGIHRESGRRQGPFVAVNCAALPETLLESELFGYEEGAFTGARKGGKQGLFELAHGGTIFLDEIGEMPLPLQARLLRVLQEKEVMRIGGDSVIPVDVRVVAATNRNVEQEVAEGRFRADLYYRLNLLRLEVPALRNRLEDIPALVETLSRKMEQKYGRRIAVDKQALNEMVRYHWPGNVRELENFTERLVLAGDGETITARDVLEHLPGPSRAEEAAPLPAPAAEAWPVHLTLAQIERLAIQHALEAEDHNLQRAAQRLGVHRTTLYRKMQQDVAE